MAAYLLSHLSSIGWDKPMWQWAPSPPPNPAPTTLKTHFLIPKKKQEYVGLDLSASGKSFDFGVKHLICFRNFILMSFYFSQLCVEKKPALFRATNKCKAPSNCVQNVLGILLSYAMFKENKETTHSPSRLHRVVLCSVLAYLSKNKPASIDGRAKILWRVCKATRILKMHNIYLKGGLSLVCI